MTHTGQAPAQISWHLQTHTDLPQSTLIDLAHGRSRGLTDELTAQRVIAISQLGDLSAAHLIVVDDVELIELPGTPA